MLFIEKEKNFLRIEDDARDFSRLINMDNGKIYSHEGKREVKTLGVSLFEITNLRKKVCSPSQNTFIDVCRAIARNDIKKFKEDNLNARAAAVLSSGILAKLDRITSLIAVTHICEITIYELLEQAISDDILTKMLRDKGYVLYLAKNPTVPLTLKDYERYLRIVEMNNLIDKLTKTDEERMVVEQLFRANITCQDITYAIEHYVRNPKIRKYLPANSNFEPSNPSKYMNIFLNPWQFISYFKMLYFIGRAPSNNFYADYPIVADLAYNKAMSKQSDEFMKRYSDVLLYENEKFCVVLPKEPQDLIQEGKEMHHCVGSYINKVCQGDCIIVFVRNKQNKTVPYITAQINPERGEITQYYLACDEHISKEEDWTFYNEYNKYIQKHAQEIRELCDYTEELNFSFF